MSTTPTLQASSPEAEETINKSWSITNNSGTDVVVIAAFANDTDSHAHFYEQSLKALETTDGQKFIKAGATGTVTLDDISNSHTIVMARADNLFPVKTAEVALDKATQTYLPVTIATDDAKYMILAEKFNKTIMAFPSSSLAQDYATALADKDVTKVDAFFKANEEYQSLTLDMVVAVNTYYNQYPFVWADYKASKTFYLYTSDGTDNIYMGSVSLHNQCGFPISTDKTVPGFSITYKKDEEVLEDIPLYFLNGNFVDDIHSESSGISLQGLFMLKSQLTNVDTDNMLISLLSGTVYGKSVLGCEEKQTKDSHGNWLGFYGFLHPENTQDWLKLIGSILGILVGVGALGKSVKVAIDALRKLKDNPSQAEIDNLNEQIKSEEEIRAESESQIARQMEQIKGKITDLILKENQRYMESIALKQHAYLEKIAEYGINENLVDVTDSLDWIDQKLNDTDLADLGNIMDELVKRIKTNSSILNKEAYAIESKASAQDYEMMEKASEAIKRSTAQLEECEKRRQEWEEDEIPEEVEVPEVIE